MARRKKIKEYEFPQSLLGQINEHSAGGFVLFAIADTGEPRVYATFDNPLVVKAMESFIKEWADSIAEINKQMMIQSICAPPPRGK